jgi:restriction system protein
LKPNSSSKPPGFKTGNDQSHLSRCETEVRARAEFGLTQLMVRYNVGVQVSETFELKQIDEEAFEE